MILNNSLIAYALKNNLEVPYFIWAWCNESNRSGLHDIEKILSKKKLNTFAVKKSLKKDNCFYLKTNQKIILKSKHKLPIHYGNKNFVFKLSGPKICINSYVSKWDATSIKYLMIVLYASQYGDEKPFALTLISEELGVSASTIQRAIKFFDLNVYCKIQINKSPRSYYYKNKIINLSPNYYKFPIMEGKISLN